VSNALALPLNTLEWAPSKNIGEQIIHRDHYAISYVDEHQQPEWVFYQLDKKMVSGSATRLNKFSPDPLVILGTAYADDYTNSGFDRGHLLPAADMKYTQSAMDDTFYMSNISPQLPGFNRALWKRLEYQVRRWANIKSSILIATGPVLEKGLPTLSKSNVSIPNQFYKIIFHFDSGNYQTIAFLMDNEKSQKHIKEFTVSIDEIEALTGIDFFSKLPDVIEDKIEAADSNGTWF